MSPVSATPSPMPAPILMPTLTSISMPSPTSSFHIYDISFRCALVTRPQWPPRSSCAHANTYAYVMLTPIPSFHSYAVYLATLHWWPVPIYFCTLTYSIFLAWVWTWRFFVKYKKNGFVWWGCFNADVNFIYNLINHGWYSYGQNIDMFWSFEGNIVYKRYPLMAWFLVCSIPRYMFKLPNYCLIIITAILQTSFWNWFYSLKMYIDSDANGNCSE